MKRIVMMSVMMAATPVFAQEFRATLTGRVVDPTGAAIPHAKILVMNTETGVKVDSTSDKSGSYTVPFLLPGKYSGVRERAWVRHVRA